jgi:hypothetical protein
MEDLTSGRELVPVSNIPDHLTAEANQCIRRHCVSMVVADDNEKLGEPCAGVLCIIEGAAGVLTARHVWERLSRAQKLVLMLGPNQPYRIARSLLDASAPLRSQVQGLAGATVPDIAFIPLPTSIKASIEARHKVFYSLDRRRNEAAFDLYGDAGFWVAIGSPVEMMNRELHHRCGKRSGP